MALSPDYRYGYAGGDEETEPKFPQSVYKTPSELTPELHTTMEMLKAFTESTTADKDCTVIRQLHENATWDTPLLIVKGKDHIRVLNAAYNWMFGPLLMEPQVVRITVPNSNVAELDYESILHWRPARHVWFPLGYLMPEDIPLHGTTSISVREKSDFLSDVKLRINNWPTFPSLVRRFNGLVLGFAATTAEPLVHPLAHYFNMGLAKTVETVEQVEQVVAPYAPQPVLDVVKGVADKIKESALPVLSPPPPVSSSPGVAEPLSGGIYGSPVSSRPIL